MRNGTGQGEGLPMGIDVAPEPAEDELAALAVALAVLLDERPIAAASAPHTPPWAVAGRRDAVRGNVGVSDRGWGRRPSRW